MSRWFAVLALSLTVLAHGADGAALAAERQKLQIVTQGGTRTFSVELAATGEELRRGLMNRRSLPAGQGMLFDFGPEQDVSMWMKNTYIPLDMLFIRGDGQIHRIEANTEPHSERVISSDGKVRAVLEVIAGTSKRLGIKPGDRVLHPMFPGR